MLCRRRILSLSHSSGFLACISQVRSVLFAGQSSSCCPSVTSTSSWKSFGQEFWGREMGSPTKGNGRSRTNSVLNIGTHDGVFHCDEVLAITMLRILPEFADAQIIRTREEEVLKTCDIVVDVGGVYDAALRRFDHHQRSFKESMSSLVPGAPWTTKLSSAGLIYVHYGKAVIAQLTGKMEDDDTIQMIYDKIYENFVEEIDAKDNGIATCACQPAYRITTTLGSQVAHLNPSWKDPKPDPTGQFYKALELVKTAFTDKVTFYAEDWLAAYELVATAVDQRFEVDKSGQIIELGAQGCPWKDHLAKIESTLGIEGELKYVIYTDQRGAWRVQGVPISPESFTLRAPLCKEWQGLRDKELQHVSKIPTAIFVHANGFIGGAADRADVLLMATRSLANHMQR